MTDAKNNTKNAFATFPLAGTSETEADSNVTIPPESDVKEVRDWVEFKEM